MLDFIWLAALKGFVAGAAGYLAQWLLRKGQSELEGLQARSPELTDRDREELLAHFVEDSLERIEGSETLTVAQGFKIIRLRTEVSATYFYLRVLRISKEGKNARDT